MQCKPEFMHGLVAGNVVDVNTNTAVGTFSTHVVANQQIGPSFTTAPGTSSAVTVKLVLGG